MFSGAYNESNGNGAVYVFQKLNSNWVQLQKLTSSDLDSTTLQQNFGNRIAVDVNGSIVAVATSPVSGSNSSIMVFTSANGNAWYPTAKLFPANDPNISPADDDYFAYNFGMSSDGHIIAAGATSYSNNGSNTGAVFIFTDSSGSWQQVNSALYDFNDDDYIGYSVSLDSNGLTVVSAGKHTIVTFEGSLIASPPSRQVSFQSSFRTPSPTLVLSEIKLNSSAESPSSGSMLLDSGIPMLLLGFLLVLIIL